MRFTDFVLPHSFGTTGFRRARKYLLTTYMLKSFGIRKKTKGGVILLLSKERKGAGFRLPIPSVSTIGDHKRSSS